MKGALSSKPNYQFDAEGHLVKATEDETDEATFLRESVAVYVEGQSPNHPADVAASNAPEEPPPPEALAVTGRRSGTVLTTAESERAAANDSNDPRFYRATPDEVEENDMEEVEEGNTPSKRGRRNR
jgi:hypothetical protein